MQAPKLGSLNLSGGETEALTLEYESDVVEKGGRYRQVLIGNSKAPQDPILIFTMQSNVALDAQSSASFDAVQKSITFGKAGSPPTLDAIWTHLTYGFDLKFDSDSWTCPPDVVLPKTELFLVGKGARETPPTFTVLVRQVDAGEEVPLEFIIEGILGDLQQLCDQSFDIISRSQVALPALPEDATRILTKGSSRNQQNNQIVEVRNAHTVFFDKKHGLVCVLAFSATPGKWDSLWPSAQQIIESFSFHDTAPSTPSTD